MKPLTLTALASVFAVSFASSFNPATAAPPGDPGTACQLERSIASNFMTMRQTGVEKEAVVADMQQQMGSELDEDTRRILDATYEASMDDDTAPAVAAEEFAEAQHAACLENQADA